MQKTPDSMPFDFNNRQLEKLSDISSDIALVAIGSVVLPAVFDKFNPVMIVSGIVATILFWIISIWLRKSR